MKKTTAIICLLLIGVFCLIESSCAYAINYNNEASANLLIDKKYSQEDIYELRDKLYQSPGKVTYSDLKKLFDIQCIRNTFQGYYIVLFLENDYKAFLFLNDNLELSHIMVCSQFHSSSELNFIEPLITTSEQIEAIDKNVYHYHISCESVSGHVLTDGYMIIRYHRLLNNQLLDKPVVNTVEFYSNDEIERSKDSFWISSAPYILPIDRI